MIYYGFKMNFLGKTFCCPGKTFCRQSTDWHKSVFSGLSGSLKKTPKNTPYVLGFVQTFCRSDQIFCRQSTDWHKSVFLILLVITKKTPKNTAYVLGFSRKIKENAQKYSVCFGVCPEDWRKRPKLPTTHYQLLTTDSFLTSHLSPLTYYSAPFRIPHISLPPFRRQHPQCRIPPPCSAARWFHW